MQTFTLYKFDKLNFFILSARHLNNIREWICSKCVEEK
jgi:hypothetical protein